MNETVPVDPLARSRLWVVLATVALNIIAVSLLTRAPWSDWRTGLALNFFDNWLLIRFAVLRGDKLLGRFILFGLVVGLAELPADAWLVDYTRTLDYSIGGGPMLWRSPLWMPLAWEIVAVQFGYLGLRLVGTASAAARARNRSHYLARSTFHSTRRWRNGFIGGNTAAAVCFRLPVLHYPW